MANDTPTKIGFVTPISSSSPHFEPFKALIPGDVEMEFEGLGIVRGPLESLRGEGDRAVETTIRLAKERGWKGVIVSGAPVEVMNPGLLEKLQTGVPVPVTTALDSCAAALHSLGAGRVLLMTPFDEPMNALIRAYLTRRRITALSPRETFKDYRDAMKVSPEEVYTLTEKAYKDSGEVDAVYFQGAVLDPIKVLDKLEQGLGRPVVASNPAMLWFILSRVGRKLSIAGYGRLLREWPPVKEEG